MTVRTVVSHCKDVPAGQGVSYGLNYRTDGASTLGLIPLGYADGVPRIATGGPVRVEGVNYPVVGRIAMDQMVIDLGPRHVAAGGPSILGAEAVLFGDGDDGGPRPRTGPGPPAPTTTRSSPGSAPGCRAATSTKSPPPAKSGRERGRLGTEP